MATGTVQYKKHKDATLALVTERLLHFNKLYGFKYTKISIRNQRSRWGSCSKKGNLNFNFRLVFLPPHLVDYVVVHELCHLREFNHSKKFWELVALGIPHHTAAREELKNVRINFSRTPSPSHEASL